MSQSTAPTNLPPNDPSVGPVSKRRTKRIHDRKVDKAAVDIDHTMRDNIAEQAANLGIHKEELLQRFAMLTPVGEQRSSSWWNGLIAEKSAEWKNEYSGPMKGYLTWVTKRIRELDLVKDLTDEDKARLSKHAASKRAVNKETKLNSMSRKHALTSAQEELGEIFEHLQLLNTRLGIEFALFTTRGRLEDNLEPSFVSSGKAATFLQGHLNIPTKDLLTLLDFWVIGKAGGLSGKIKSRKEILRCSVRAKLLASFCTVVRATGRDASSIKCIKYTNYDHLVHEYHIIIRGYPIHPNGQIIRPSDLPGGVKGLLHADVHLGDGTWGFEKLTESAYKEWKSQCDQAKSKNTSCPIPPYIPVPGTEFKNRPEEASKAGTDKNKRKAPGESGTVKASKVHKEDHGKAKKSIAKVKSRATIEDSDEDEDSNFGSTTEESEDQESESTPNEGSDEDSDADD
ncbi:hypothetical protein CTheo_6668 [Ceratobasidium theobromae]|uniref:Uncharacterized protein n=1 Tax=Ceratobasidium theobromae TaxID=1582974 RepID=A0A5N5QDR0_9AGAM|nr:hypothetical protein CTheo_6668 [Ceratobasidium theobromae]